jgi:peroxiredoxin
MFTALTLSLALTALGSPAEARKAAPDFELKDLAGKRVKLSQLNASGKTVLIEFWATWCVPCIAALPHLDKLHREFSEKGLTVLAISTDGPQTLAQVRSLVKREKLSMPVLLDPEGKVFAALNPRGTNPFTLIIDRSGKIAESHEGYTAGDEKKYREWVERLLAENAKP